MSKLMKPEVSCVPYRRRGLYFGLTIPLTGLLLVVFIYLVTVSFFVALVFLSFYLAMCYFQAYCCAYQECPYVGGFCPAIAGIYPANPLAKLLYGQRPVVKSARRFEIHATLASCAGLGLLVFPLYWLWQAGLIWAVAYGGIGIVYLLAFTLTICPVCAIRDTCPAGQVQRWILTLRGAFQGGHKG